jgi:hypothetical protein
MPSYPNRCQHIKVNGTQCGSPALRRNRFCYFHKRHHDERIELNADRQKNGRARRCSIAIDLPVFEDANSIQVSLMQITRLLIAATWTPRPPDSSSTRCKPPAAISDARASSPACTM